MIPSQLNKLITIEKENTTVNAVGTPTEVYLLLRKVWANVYIKSGATEFNMEGAVPFTMVEFTIRYDPQIDYKCRILYENQYYHIAHIETIERKHWLKIRATVWENEYSNGQ